jgi:hypothetical protein
MGALISTIGTRYIVSNLNRAFSPPRIGNLRNDPPIGDPAGNGQTIAQYFNPAQGHNLLWLSQNMKHRHSQRPNNETFLPEDTTRSPHAEQRWIYFLTAANPNVLTAANHTAIRNLIWKGLTDLDATGALKYNRIEFDAIDDQTDGGGHAGQNVLWSDEVDDHKITYLRIVLVTPPIYPNNSGVVIAGLPALDPQPGPG